WKMKVVRRLGRRVALRGETHAAVGDGIEVHALEAGISIRPTLERADRVDPDAVEAVRAALIEGDHLRADLDAPQKEVLVAHARETIFLLRRRETRHVIDFLGFEPGDILLSLRGQRHLREEIRPRDRGRTSRSS